MGCGSTGLPSSSLQWTSTLCGRSVSSLVVCRRSTITPLKGVGNLSRTRVSNPAPRMYTSPLGGASAPLASRAQSSLILGPLSTGHRRRRVRSSTGTSCSAAGGAAQQRKLVVWCLTGAEINCLIASARDVAGTDDAGWPRIAGKTAVGRRRFLCVPDHSWGDESGAADEAGGLECPATTDRNDQAFRLRVVVTVGTEPGEERTRQPGPVRRTSYSVPVLRTKQCGACTWRPLHQGSRCPHKSDIGNPGPTGGSPLDHKLLLLVRDREDPDVFTVDIKRKVRDREVSAIRAERQDAAWAPAALEPTWPSIDRVKHVIFAVRKEVHGHQRSSIRTWRSRGRIDLQRPVPRPTDPAVVVRMRFQPQLRDSGLDSAGQVASKDDNVAGDNGCVGNGVAIEQ